MKVAFLSILILWVATAGYAQDKKLDLASDPNQPALQTGKSNAQLLLEAKPQPAETVDSINTQSLKTTINTTNTSYNSSQLDNNGQPLNTQSQQLNIGNKKATSTIQYDNSGKVRGNGTTIDLSK
ncbi:MAG TPA: hypothetical protein VL098_04470 [Flavipsychrobacter sp.]|nr:hypothetical protein [Flavipsychrobacter sp.]